MYEIHRVTMWRGRVRGAFEYIVVVLYPYTRFPLSNNLMCGKEAEGGEIKTNTDTQGRTHVY